MKSFATKVAEGEVDFRPDNYFHSFFSGSCTSVLFEFASTTPLV
jgi:hypothetical protein